jgi:hypothetical protein
VRGRIGIFVRSPVTNFNFSCHVFILVDLTGKHIPITKKFLLAKQKLGASNADTQFFVEHYARS